MEVSALKTQIGAINGELTNYHSENAQRDATIGNMRSDINSLKDDVVKDYVLVKQGEKRLKAFEVDLYMEVQEATSSDDWLGAAARLAAKHGPTAGRRAPDSQVDFGFIAESIRQQAFLSKTLSKLRSESVSATSGATTDMGAKADDIVAENAALISQIASLNDTIQVMRAETKQLNLRVAQRGGVLAASAAAGTGHRAVAATKRGP
jgi:hypothetical protein